MMQSVLSNSSKIVVDQKGSASLLNLPLDKLMQAAGATAAPAPTTDAAQPRAPEPTVTIDPSRSRESLRSRESR